MNETHGSLTTTPFDGGHEIDYHDEHGQRLYAHLYDDGRLVISIGDDYIGLSITLPPGYTSVLRDYLLHVLPISKGEETAFLSLLAEYGEASVDIETAGSIEAMREAAQRRTVVENMLLDLYRAPKDI